MIDLERRAGPWSWRVWGLIANFAGNAVALLGAARVLRDGSGWPLLVTGLIVTVACIAIVAVPSPDRPEAE